MAWRRALLTAIAAAMAGGAALSSIPAQAAMRPVPGPGAGYQAAIPLPFVHGRFVSAAQLTAQLAACEDRMRRTRQAAGAHVPTVVIVGASFTAGVGSGHPDASWAALLARRLGWDAVVYGDPGAGYVRAGLHRQGPVARELTEVGLRELNPARVRDGLHPTAAGSAWIAAEVSQILQGRGVHPVLLARGAGAAPGPRPDSIICDFGIHVAPAVRIAPAIQLPAALH